jgi:hypothetical protein
LRNRSKKDSDMKEARMITNSNTLTQFYSIIVVKKKIDVLTTEHNRLNKL